MLSERWIKKYMRMAKHFGEDDNRCHSRKIGVVIVDPRHNQLVSTGLNGPPRKVPPCDSWQYLEDIFWPQLTKEERETACQNVDIECTGFTELDCYEFAKNAAGCGKCPRKLVGAKSGERLELCSCEHGEKNAIYNASVPLVGSWMFCACGVPCWDCSKAIINAGVVRVYAVDDPSYANQGKDYSFGSRWLLKQAGVELIVKPVEYYASV